jgi:hypothetical protein
MNDLNIQQHDAYYFGIRSLVQYQSSFARGCFVVDRDSAIDRLFFKNS